jgi:hypothetical protein
MKISYNDAHALLKEAGRRDKKGISMYLALQKLKDTLATKLGIECRRIDFYWDNGKIRRPTLRKLLTLLGDGNYIVTIRGHAFAICQNTIIDVNRPSLDCRSVFVYRIENNNTKR